MIDLAANRTTQITAARNLLATIKSAAREPTQAEQQVLQAHMDQVAVLDRQIKGRALVHSVTSLGSHDDTGPSNSDGIFSPEAKTGIATAIRSHTSFRTELVGTKAALTSGTLLPTSGVGVVEGLHPNSQFPIASLFANEPASGPSVRFYRTTAGTAAVVAESSAKPDSGIAFTAVDVLLSKLVALAQYSTEMTEDAPHLIQALQVEMVAAIIAAENKLILDTLTATAGTLNSTGTAVTVIDLVADAVAAQQALSGLTPSAIIASPATVAVIRKAKASTGGSYMVDPLTSAPSGLHGVPLVASPAVPATVAWLVCSTGVTLYRRGPVTFEVGYNATDWASNLNTAISEERVAVGVGRPSSISKITLS